MPLTQEELIQEWNELIERNLEVQRTIFITDFALERQRQIEQIEAEAAAKGIPLPKRSHLFAPENLWPDGVEAAMEQEYPQSVSGQSDAPASRQHEG